MQLPAWGSYEGWSALVRSAVVWVGLPDPGLTRVVLQDAADTPANCMAVIADCWERMDLERRGLTASEVVDRLRTERENGLDNAPDWHRDLRDSIEALTGKLDARLLGNKLRAYRRRVFDGRYFDHAGTSHRAVRWAVYPTSSFADGLNNTHETHKTHSADFGVGSECGESGESLSTDAEIVNGNGAVARPRYLGGY